MERIDVPVRWWVVSFDDLFAELVSRADQRAAAFTSLEERILVDFTGRGVVDDVAGFDPFVLGAEPGIDPECFSTNDLFLLVAHRSRHVHHVDDDRVVLVANVAFPGPVAHVRFDRNNDWSIWIVGAGCDLATKRLAEGPLEAAKRVRALMSNRRVLLRLALQSFVAARFDLRQLKLLAHDLSELLKREIDFELVLSALISRLTFALALLWLALPDGITRFAVPLSKAALFLVSETETRNLDLRQRDSDSVLPFTADHLAVGHVLLEVVLDLPFYDVSKTSMIAPDIIKSQSLAPFLNVASSEDARDVVQDVGC